MSPTRACVLTDEFFWSRNSVGNFSADDFFLLPISNSTATGSRKIDKVAVDLFHVFYESIYMSTATSAISADLVAI